MNEELNNIIKNAHGSIENRINAAYNLGRREGYKEQEPCEDVISRQAALDLVADYDLSMGQVVKGIHALPPVNPQPKTGHWIKTPKAVMGEGYMWYCDKCEHQVYQDSSRDYPSEKYCPNCGAKMSEIPTGSESEE